MTCLRLTFFPCRWLIVLVLCVVVSCSRDEGTAGGPVARSYIDESYGADTSQVMDIYLPQGRSVASTPLLVLFHGGAWISGDKDDFAGYLDSIRSLLPGYAIANVNYRLASFGVNLFPTQEQDAKLAVQFLVRHLKDYGISERFVYLGVSAGGQMALLQAYKPSEPAAAAVVSFFGPTDMRDLAVHSPDPTIIQFLPLLMGGTPSENPALYLSSSPVHFVGPASCPTLLLQGGKDPLVPAGEAYELADTLNAYGVPNQLVYYPDQGHGWDGPDLADSFDRIAAFLQRYVH